MLTLNSSNQGPRKTKRDYHPEQFVEVFGSFERPFRDRWKEDDPNPTRFTTNTEYLPSTLRAMKYKGKPNV